MVTARGRIDLRRAAKFGAHADERRGEQAAAVEVADERGEPLVEGGRVGAHVCLDGVVVVPTAVGERDEPHARLDEPPREQHPHAGGIATVFILDGVGLLRHVERFLRLGGTDQSVGPLIEGVEGVERVALLLLPKVVVDDVEHPPPLVKPRHVDASRQVEVADLKLWIGRIGAEAESGVGTRQVARARELVGDARDADVGG